MIILDEWQRKWNVHPAAVADLANMLTANMSHALGGKSEQGVSQRVRLEFAKRGALLFRNNVGACMTEQGTMVRYGLANESKQLNQSVKSSDLIGIEPVTITPDMIGATIGRFIAIETKRPNWKFTGSDHEKAQLSFLTLIKSKGGKGEFIS